ncbi:carbohydrate-binding protein [Roseivirga pacifica]|uniref:carbohydrate-binding protein n=1 Tax=Roseivirga pacifica TaxID=1267423 RepID=UPI00227ABBB2|nr:carbohydrate-binding protein [Roseivirga pacifica]
MKNGLTTGLAFIACLILLPINSIAQGFLKTDGQKIVDENNNEIIWRGIGLGGWMLQEGYMLGTGGPQHEIEEKITALVGAERTETFYNAWLANHVRKVDIDSMASWGYNMVRLPMHYKLFTPPIEDEPVEGEITWIDKGFEMTDALLEWCKANDIYLILDLHAAPGGQGENADISDYDKDKPSLWESEANKEKMIALWRKLAERYKDETHIAAYDIINEPNWGFQNHASDLNGCAESANTPLWNLQKEVTAAIREVDQNHIIVIEGNCWGNNYNGLPSLWDDNIVISYHKYWNPNTQGAIQGMLDMRSSRNVPIWLGETGENSNTWFTNAINLFETNSFGWSWWPLKKLGGNNPLQIKRNDGYQAILDYWHGNGAKPSADEAYDALMQMTEDLKLENNVYHPDVVDAKIRQPHTDEIIPFKKHTVVPNEDNVIFAVDYDLGKNQFAYFDIVSSNTTGDAGGAAWNTGGQYRNDGVDIQASTDEGVTNGYTIGWTEDTEWLKYTVQVEEEGNYDLTLRTAGGGGQVSVSINDVKAAATIELPNTGGYNNWQSTTVEDVYLKAGENVMQVYIDKAGFNINYMQLNGPTQSNSAPVLIDKKGTNEKKKIELVFNQPFETIHSDHGFSLTVNGEAVSITSAAISEVSDRTIELEADTELHYNDEIFLSYNGTGVVSKNGVPLAAFDNEEIKIVLEGGVIPHMVPGRIEAEDFINNSGFEVEQTQDAGGGSNVGHTDNGDYLDFMVDVQQAGYYDVSFRVSSESNGGSLALRKVLASGSAQLLSQVQFGATGAWQNWVTEQGALAYLEKGLQTLRLQATASLFNINWFELEFVSETEPTSIEKQLEEAPVNLYPNPTEGKFTIEFAAGFQPSTIFIQSQNGQKQKQITPQKGIEQMEVNEPLSSGLYILIFEDANKLTYKKLLIN